LDTFSFVLSNVLEYDNLFNDFKNK
jgi:hypothetical protein